MFRPTLLLLITSTASALDYPHVTAEPQKTGWPLTVEERAYVVDKPEHDRRPGRESNKHLPKLWPQVATAGHFGGDSWLKLHEAHVKTVQANQGPVDVLLVGDSITIQWGESWKKHFPDLEAVNIGIGGDKTQNVLWRLDHGGVEGLQPKAIVLMIGNNNMFFTPETGIEAAALGIQMCVKNLHEKFPAAAIIVAKILPAHAPGNRFYEDIKKTNAALDPLKLDSDPKVTLLDLWPDFTNADGTIKKDLVMPDNIHLSPAGYAVYAERLRRFLESSDGSNRVRELRDSAKAGTTFMKPWSSLVLICLSSWAVATEPKAVFGQLCYECHDAETKKGDLDLTALTMDERYLDLLINVHDAVERGEMPPKEKKQPAEPEKAAFVKELDAKLMAMTAPARSALFSTR